MSEFQVGDVVEFTGRGWDTLEGECAVVVEADGDLYRFKTDHFSESLAWFRSDAFDLKLVMRPEEVAFKEDSFRTQVQAVLKEIEDLLVEKNEAYGDAALNPVNVFSDLDVDERLNVRIDDKLQRLASGREFGQEDTVQDLMGYLVLKRVREAQRN